MVAFSTLKSNFPDDEDKLKSVCFDKRPKKIGRPFDNYCSIKLSEALNLSGVSLSGGKATMCWSHSGKRHIIRAQEFADWLSKSPPAGFGPKTSVPPSTFKKTLDGKTGIVFFRDYWCRPGETIPTGDHIDLWNKDRLTASPMWVRSILEFFNFQSDLEKSKEVLFWEIK